MMPGIMGIMEIDASFFVAKDVCFVVSFFLLILRVLLKKIGGRWK